MQRSKPITAVPQQGRVLPKVQKANAERFSRWVTRDNPDEAAIDLFGHFNGLVRAQGSRLWANTMAYSLYTNSDMATCTGNMSSVSLNMPNMTYNLIKTDTDVVAGTLVQSNARAVIQTSNGTWDDWTRARKMEQAIEGEWARGNIYDTAQRVAIDALNCGSGFMKLYTDEKSRIAFDYVWCNNVFFDEYEAALSKPRTMFEMRYVRRDVLLELYPDQADIINRANDAQAPKFNWSLFAPGMIMVVEGWALGVGQRPGRHTIALSSGALIDEQWDHDYFPIVQFRVGDVPLNPYGQGYTQQVAASQISLNKYLNIMEEAAYLGTSPFWVIGEGSGVTPDMIQNKTRVITASDPNGVQYHYQPPFHPDAYTYTREIERYIHNFYGINQLQANTTDSGLNRFDSSKAMNAYIDSSDTRHILLLERWQTFFIDIARRTIMLAGDIAKKEGHYPVAVGAVQNMQTLDWKDILMEENSYRVSVGAANVLGNTVSQKLTNVKELADQGLISQAQAQRALAGPPDMNALLGEATALEDYTDWVIARIVDDGKFIAPTVADDLPHMLVRIGDARCQYITRGLPAVKIRLFERWLTEAFQLVAAAQPQNPGVPTNAASSPAVNASATAAAQPGNAGAAVARPDATSANGTNATPTPSA